jgi:hypothetical protein
LAFTSKQLSKRNLGKPIYEKEMLSILHVIDLWCPYLLGKRFQIKTDHQSLKYFMEQCISSQEQQKWVTPTAGHSKFTKTYDRVKRSFFWDGMKQDL